MTSPAKAASVVSRTSPLQSSNETLTVSLVIPVYNGGENFLKCVVSVKALLPPPAEVIVVGDGDDDGSSQLAEEHGLTVLRFPFPGGPARRGTSEQLGRQGRSCSLSMPTSPCPPMP